MRKMSSLSLVSPSILRNLLIERMRKDPELFLLENRPTDLHVIATIINEECETQIDAYNRSLDDDKDFIDSLDGVENHPCNIRMIRDLNELMIPFRIALTGWLLLPEFALPNLALRLYKYSVGEDNGAEEQLMFESLAVMVQAKQLRADQIAKIYKSSRLTQYIKEKLNS